MMRILLSKTNLILILIIALVVCMIVRPIRPLSIQTSVIELFNDSVHMSQEEVMETMYNTGSVVALFGHMWLALYLLTKMLSFYISFAYIKGWLIKVSQITCDKARLDFLHLKAGVRNELSNKYLLTIYTLHSN